MKFVLMLLQGAMLMARNSCNPAQIHDDQRVKAVDLIADMIEYRNTEISQISREIQQGIRILHGELIPGNRVRQANTLAALTERLAQLIADDEYDTGSLQQFLEHSEMKTELLALNHAEESISDLHYFQ